MSICYHNRKYSNNNGNIIVIIESFYLYLNVLFFFSFCTKAFPTGAGKSKVTAQVRGDVRGKSRLSTMVNSEGRSFCLFTLQNSFEGHTCLSTFSTQKTPNYLQNTRMLT